MKIDSIMINIWNKVFLFLFLYLLTVTVFGQGIKVSGYVESDKGEALPGASVLIKDTTTGVVTDIEGNFNIELENENAILVFRYIGFLSQEITVGDQTEIKVTLAADAKQLDDVVVVGYGTKSKKEVIGSISQTDGKEIQKSPSINLANSLSGRLSGLFINQQNAEPGRDDPQILIRGRGTFNSNGPLIVVDGIIDRDGISRIDPQDVESVTVLKDATAAIYGSRAANGVILVTTKRGADGKAVLNYSFQQSISQPSRFVKNATSLDFARQANAIDLRTADSNNPNYRPPFSPAQMAEFAVNQGTDWWREVFDRTSLQSRHSLSLRGGTKSSKYFISAGTAQQDGIVVGDNQTNIRQYNIRSNVDLFPVENLKVNLDLAGRLQNNQTYGFSSFDIIQNTAKNLPAEHATLNGNILRTEFNINPLALVGNDTGYERTKNTLFNSTLGIDYKIPFIEGLSVNAWAAVDVTQNFVKSWQTPYSIFELDDSNQLDEVQIERGITLNENHFRKESITLHGKLAYSNAFGLHNVSGFLAYEQNESFEHFSSAFRDGFSSPQVDELFAGSEENARSNGSSSESARQNYLGRISYDYKGKYLAQFHFRYDGSSNFPKENRFGFFPGLSVGWNMSDEGFMQASNSVSSLKLRASWGKLGNDRILPFQHLLRFGPNGSFPIGGVDANVISQIGVEANPGITWEVAEIINLGVDAAFLENKLYLELEVFKEKRKNILTPRNASIPNYTGLTLPDENVGETENKGFEAVVRYQTDFNQIAFNIDANFSYARNKIIFRDEVEPVESYQALEGHPVASRLLYDAIGIYRTQDDLDNHPGLPGVELGDLIYNDTNGDGELNAADRIVFDRNATPEMIFGLTLGAEYKGFKISVLLQGQTRASIEVVNLFDPVNGINAPEYFVKNSWTPDTPNASLPNLGRENQNFSSGGAAISGGTNFWQRDASFLRIKNVELSYNVPSNLTSKIGASDLRVYVNAFNLLTFDGFRKDGLADPEQTNALTWTYPHQRIINLGLNVTF